jgi:hypothetical protein
MVVSLQTASLQCDPPVFDSSILRIFASSRQPVQRDPPDFVPFVSFVVFVPAVGACSEAVNNVRTRNT